MIYSNEYKEYTMKKLPKYDVRINTEENWFTKAIEEAEKREKKNARHTCHLLAYTKPESKDEDETD